MGVANVHLMLKEDAARALAKEAGIAYEEPKAEEPKKKEDKK